MKEGKFRSICKALTWRLLGLLVLTSVGYFLYYNLPDILEISIYYHVIMVVLFFIHERIWNTLNWGRDTNNRTGLTIQMTGLSGAGKSTIALSLIHI